MGAQSFEHKIKASTPKKGFDWLIEQADYYDGHDCYNGSINTTSLGRTVKIADKYTPKADKDAEKWIEKNGGYVRKWDCVCLDLGVTEYVSHKNTKKVYTPKRPSLKFVVSAHGEKDKEFKTIALARKYAATLVSKGMDYSIKKDYGTSLIETSNIKTTTHTRKTKDAEEIHTYVYYGWAAC